MSDRVRHRSRSASCARVGNGDGGQLTGVAVIELAFTHTW
jgi:hypothetical protein